MEPPAKKTGKKEKKFLKVILTVLGVYILINLIVYTDVYLRARSSYLKGVQYLEWFEEPQLKKNFLDKWLKERLHKIPAGEKSENEILKKAIEMQYKMQMEDNDAKNAYFWFQTTVECFQPPRSKYVRLAEEKMAIAKKLWDNSAAAQE
ncbi:MAG: hypothetical protein ABIJ15_02140 [bacterium]